MATPKRSGPDPRLLAAAALILAWFALGCRPAPRPTLARAFAVRGGVQERAKAFMLVAVSGAPAEARRAAFLAGAFAAEAHAPLVALHAYTIAKPEGTLARLAARRLEDALAGCAAPASAWQVAAAAPLLTAGERTHLLLRGAELWAARGDVVAAVSCLPPMTSLHGDEVPRALAVRARVADVDGGVALRRLAVSWPTVFVGAFAGRDPAALKPQFSGAEWTAHAAGWLAAGEAEKALRAAAHAGPEAAVVAAKAALRLHRTRVALGWAERGGVRCAGCLAERAEALRQAAWAASGGERQKRFAELLQAARRAREISPASDEGRAELLLAEALTELGRFADAAPHLDAEAAHGQPRWEWVWRRWVMLQATQQRPGAKLGAVAGGTRSSRGTRLAQYWQARAAARAGDRSGLAALAGGGFPDLPALWAARDLGVLVAPFAMAKGMPAMVPPAWAPDLLSAGRVADVVVAWRLELEANGSSPGWLGLAALAQPPPLEAIPLLVRGEPRLLSGPWQGLAEDLLRRYLPLPWRRELEAAAEMSHVPPWLLAGLVRQESAWNPRARSAANALGLAQVLPDAGAEVARELPAAVGTRGDLLDPARNLAVGAALLARWRRSFPGSWEAALAAYNAGERRIRATWETAGRKGGPLFVEALEIPETWDYIHRVVLLAEGYRVLYWPEGRAYPWT
jgi:soluble lytic murein transglycosylase-like protein